MFQIRLLTRNLIVVLLSLSGLAITGDFAWAIETDEATVPLAIPQNDPLLPPEDVERELSPLEKKRIRAEINTLEIDASTQLELGKSDSAFALWFRQLRLYRAINLATEIAALGRVGEIAWQNNYGAELKVITERLNEIYQEAQANDSLDPDLLKNLGASYQQTRNLDTAIAVYGDLLQLSRTEANLQPEQTYLATLGELYLDKFDYSQAAIIYQDLLSLAQAEADPILIEQYLLKLSKIYDYTQQLEQAISTKTQLINYYQDTANESSIVKLKIAVGNDYLALDQTDLAIKSYREAIAIGQSTGQIASTSEALQKLSKLYQQQEEYNSAIAAYQQLLNIELQAYNSYGVMNSYDSLGQLYLKLEDYDRALIAFSQGLEVAQSLDYQISYFANLIDQVRQKIE